MQECSARQGVSHVKKHNRIKFKLLGAFKVEHHSNYLTKRKRARQETVGKTEFEIL